MYMDTLTSKERRTHETGRFEENPTHGLSDSA